MRWNNTNHLTVNVSYIDESERNMHLAKFRMFICVKDTHLFKCNVYFTAQLIYMSFVHVFYTLSVSIRSVNGHGTCYEGSGYLLASSR